MLLKILYTTEEYSATSQRCTTPHIPWTCRSELAWLFANHNWTRYLADYISPEFGFYQNFRYYEYEYEPTLEEHGCVRVVYRKDLLPHAADSPLPKFQPWQLDDEGK